MKALLVGLALAALCIPAHAAGISLGKPGYGGNGCPAGTADVALGAGGKTLTLRFDSYQASAGGSSGKSLDRKTCNLAIPVKVPAGKSVSIIAIDFRGQSRLPAGASARLQRRVLPRWQQRPEVRPQHHRPQDWSVHEQRQADGEGVVCVWSGRDPSHQFQHPGQGQRRQGRVLQRESAGCEDGGRLFAAVARLLRPWRPEPLLDWHGSRVNGDPARHPPFGHLVPDGEEGTAPSALARDHKWRG